MAQKIELFYIFSDVSKNKEDYLIKVPKLKTKKINYLNNKSLAQVKLAQKNALIQSFKKLKYHLEN